MSIYVITLNFKSVNWDRNPIDDVTPQHNIILKLLFQYRYYYLYIVFTFEY